VQRLHELGWAEGRTVTIEYRWAEGRSERYVEIAAEFVRLRVDVIVTSGGAGLATQRATSVIPIVLASAGDPVADGLVLSLARPGGNVTGLSIQAPDIAGKRLYLLHQVLPGLHRLAILANVGYPAAMREMGQAQAMASKLGFTFTPFELRRAEDIIPAFDALKSGADALYVVADPLVGSDQIRINTLALAARLPTMPGGLMSYGANFEDLYRRAAEFVDKILRGGKPADIPVEQPTKFDFVINLTTAKTIGLIIPDKLLAISTEVIE
jgi:putative ABC transport system substrate-binding protein